MNGESDGTMTRGKQFNQQTTSPDLVVSALASQGRGFESLFLLCRVLLLLQFSRQDLGHLIGQKQLFSENNLINFLSKAYAYKLII